MTPRNLRLALLALCIGLASAVAAEAYVLIPKANAPVASTGQKAVRAQINVPEDIDPMVAEILARPLFTSTRMPAEMPGADEEIAEVKVPPQLQARLAGISLGPDAREALFQREGEGNQAVAVKVGGEIDGWKVSAIRLDGVVLTSEFGQQVIKPADATSVDDGDEGVPPPKVAQTKVPPMPGSKNRPNKSPTVPNRPAPDRN